MLRPDARVTVKVIDVARGKRLFPVPRPAEGPRGVSVRVKAAYRYKDQNSNGDVLVVMQTMAQLIGREVAFLFYDHLPHQPGQERRD